MCVVCVKWLMPNVMDTDLLVLLQGWQYEDLDSLKFKPQTAGTGKPSKE